MGSGGGYSEIWIDSVKSSHSCGYRYTSNPNSVVEIIKKRDGEVTTVIGEEINKDIIFREPKENIEVKELKKVNESRKIKKESTTIGELVEEYRRITKEIDYKELSRKYVNLFKLIKKILDTMKNIHKDQGTEFNYSDDEIGFLMEIEQHKKMIDRIERAFNEITDSIVNNEEEVSLEEKNEDLNDFIDYTL